MVEPVDKVYVANGQAVQLCVPLPDANKPTSHNAHTPLPAAADLPGAQSTQAEEPAKENLPAGHDEQLSAPLSEETLPASQSTQLLSALLARLPGAHATHAVAAAPEVEEPGPHTEQLDAPNTEE